MFKRIVVTWDQLRIDDQRDMHIRLADSLFHLIKWPVYWGTGYKPKLIGDKEQPLFFAQAYKSGAKEILPKERWLDIYNAEPDDALCDLIGATFSDALVIGFELAPYYKKVFSKCGITYIDLVIHPVRFFSDIFYGFSTNNPIVDKFLQKKSLPDRLFYHAAAVQQARYAPNIVSHPLPTENILFVVGQTPQDKVLISPQRSFHSLLDFTEQVDALSREHELTVFKPHPYGTDENIISYFAGKDDCIALPSPAFPDLNTYIYLSHPGITTFVGLNSSVLVEARYFEKLAINLLPYEFNFTHEQPGEQPTAWPIFRDCFTESFWYELVFQLTQLRHTLPPPMPVVPIPNLRLTLRGGGSFDDAASYTQCLKIGALENALVSLKEQVLF
jgi:hypothetical protein